MLDAQNQNEYIILALALFALINLVLTILMWLKLQKFLRGHAENIPDTLSIYGKELDNLHNFRKELEPYLAKVEARVKRSLQGLHTLRFNPFSGDGSGGLQSFATAILNEHGDGVILSSLYMRDRMSVYSKPVKNFKSEFELTTEEAEALSKAKESCKL